MKYTIHYLDETPSTMDAARELVAQGAPSFSVAWTRRQTHGRGRLGRSWQGFSRNVMATIMLRPGDAHQQTLFLPYVAALAISDAVRSFVPTADVAIKWPNDVLVDGAKVSGLLIETQTEPAAFLVGIGINVGEAPLPEDVLFPATSLGAVLKRDVSVPEVLHRLVERFCERCEMWRAEGFSGQLRGEYSKRLWRLNAEITLAADKEKAVTTSGINLGLSDAGGLRLQTPDGEREFFAGDVF